jgi:hypothetical protein
MAVFDPSLLGHPSSLGQFLGPPEFTLRMHLGIRAARSAAVRNAHWQLLG